MIKSHLLFLFVLLPCTLSSPSNADTVLASWYGPGFENRRMANGEPFHAADASIAAHKSLPLGTLITVTNPMNGRSIVMRVCDRGPYVRDRSLDLSYAAAQKLGFALQGVAPLTMEVTRSP